MGTHFSFISELQTIREQKSRLSERESELTKPLLTDINLIQDIYKEFSRIKGQVSNRRDSVRAREQFIFIILMLYSPKSLAGDSILHGLRQKLAETIQITAKTVISNNYKDLFFIYQTHRDFRNEIDDLYSEIEIYLRNKELIK